MKHNPMLESIMDIDARRKVRRHWIFAICSLIAGIILIFVGALIPLIFWLKIILFVIGFIGIFWFIFFVSTTKYGQFRSGAGPSFWVP